MREREAAAGGSAWRERRQSEFNEDYFDVQLVDQGLEQVHGWQEESTRR